MSIVHRVLLRFDRATGLRLVVLATACVAGSLCNPLGCFAAGPLAELSGTVAYVGATLIDGSGTAPIADAVIIVAGDRIVAAGPANTTPVPPGARRVALAGRWIIPGLIDMHVHFYESGRPPWMVPEIQSTVGSTVLANEAERVRTRLPYTLSRFLCAGVTSALSLSGPDQIEFRAREISEEDNSIAPRVFISGKLIANFPTFEPEFLGENSIQSAKTPAEARRKVLDLHRHGVDVIKLLFASANEGWVTPPIDDKAAIAMLEAATTEAHLQGLPVLLHTGTLQAAKLFMHSGLDAFAHLPFDAPADEEYIASALRARVAVTTTIGLNERYVDVLRGTLQLLDIEKECADPEVLRTYETLRQDYPPEILKQALDGMVDAEKASRAANASSIRKIVAAGIPLIVGSDSSHLGTPHGTSIHYEMLRLQEMGVSPMDIIVASTRNAARVLRRDQVLGTVTPGKVADFLVLRADPLARIQNVQQIEWVVKGGKAYLQKGIQASSMLPEPGAQMRR